MQTPSMITRMLMMLAMALALGGCALPPPAAPLREPPPLPAATPSGV